MNYAELLLQYNGFLLVFSATGFLISLVWAIISEKSQRKIEDESSPLSKKALFDDKAFFNEFDTLENPAMGTTDLKPIFENTMPDSTDPRFGQDDNSEVQSERKFIKMNELPKFPSLQKEIEHTLSDKKEDKNEVTGLLDEIKKDIKKNTKEKYKKK